VAETRLQRSKVEMGYRLIRAPISGTVLEVTGTPATP
jgi:hypothetical protein